MESLYQTQDYREFIRTQLEQNAQVRGYQGMLAKGAGCQGSYLSRVLAGGANLNSEQAMRLALFWNLSGNQTDYWLELVQLGRTDFAPLQERLRQRLDAMRSKAENLATRLEETQPLGADAELVYYSQWYFSAIHILLGIPGFQTPGAIAERLSIPKKTVESALVQLKQFGLVTAIADQWQVLPVHLHLAKDSVFTAFNHANWRDRAVLHSRQPDADGLHYSCIQTHTHADSVRIKQVFLEALDQARAIIRPSEREELTCINLDFFRV